MTSGKMAANGENNFASAGVVIIGDKAVVNMNGSPPNAQRRSSVANAPPCTVYSDSGDGEVVVVEKISKFIADDYRGKYSMLSQFPWEFNRKPIKDFFTNLDFKPADISCASHGDGDLMYKIFEGTEELRTPTRVLLYGNAGAGKTTLCQKYAYDWADPRFESPAPFNAFKIVVFLKMCEVRGSLEEVMENEVFCGRLTHAEKQLLFSYMNKHPEEILFLLDGVNERELDELNDVKHFLEDRAYKGVHVIATSRPEITQDWLNLSKTFHSRYSISGYSVENALKFVARFFSEDQVRGELLMEHLKNSPYLMELAQFPLLTPIICELWHERRELPILPTTTRLLSSYVDVVVRLHMLGSEQVESRGKEFLTNHGRLAWFGIQENKHVFTVENVNEYNIHQEVGFLSAQPQSSSVRSAPAHYKFAHDVVQDFFAARWLVEVWEKDETQDILKKILDDSKISCYSYLVVFIAGLLSADAKDDALLNFLLTLATSSAHGNFLEQSCYGRRMQLLLESVYEAWQDENQSLNRRVVDMFGSSELFKKIVNPNHYPLRMSHAGAQGLVLVLSTLRSETTTLNLSGIVIASREAKLIASKCFRNNGFLTSVKFSHCCLSEDAVEAICQELSTMHRLRELDLSRCHLSDKGLGAITNLIQDGNSGITSLHLGNTTHEIRVENEQRDAKLSEEAQNVLRHTILVNIEWIENFQECCRASTPSDDAIRNFVRAIEDESELEVISIPSCCVGNLIGDWLKTFEKLVQLTEIKLHLKELDEKLQEDLITLVNEHTNLQRMSVILEDNKTQGPDYHFLASSKEKTNGKLQIKYIDYTHSVRTWFEILVIS